VKKSNSFFKVDNLNYKDILKDISFKLKENSFNILIGPNSCGKTMLVKCLGGLLEYEGNIFLDNCVIPSKNRNLSIKKDIGIVLDCDFIFDSNVLLNLLFPLLNLGYTEMAAKKRIYSVLDELELGYLLMKKVDQLNIQEKKLFCLLRAVIQDYKVLIVDDIFDELNNAVKKKIFEYFKKLKNKTILFLTHNEEYILYANSTIDSIIIMNDGKVMEQERLKEIIKNEKNFIKNKLILPFEIDLSHKLKTYNLLNDIVTDMDEMVNEIWQ